MILRDYFSPHNLGNIMGNHHFFPKWQIQCSSPWDRVKMSMKWLKLHILSGIPSNLPQEGVCVSNNKFYTLVESMIVLKLQCLNNAFNTFIKMAIFFLYFIWLMWSITLINWQMLNHSCIPWINPTWSCFIILLMLLH